MFYAIDKPEGEIYVIPTDRKVVSCDIILYSIVLDLHRGETHQKILEKIKN